MEIGNPQCMGTKKKVRNLSKVNDESSRDMHRYLFISFLAGFRSHIPNDMRAFINAI